MSKYRPDIDGLRGISVLLVVIYHAFPARLKAGFIGVDVFFVISGFLISSIVFKELEQGNFSIVHFYIRRIKRIFPALLVVILGGLIGCIFVEGSFASYQTYLKQATAASGFFVNFQLVNETGYFSPTADKQPLLHIWSLSIEEQYYIVWPALTILLWQFRKLLGIILPLLGLASFIYSLRLTATDSSAAFYSPFARSWELLAGGYLAYAAHKGFLQSIKYADVISACGLLCIAIAQFFITPEKPYPGLWAVLPVAAGVCIIAAGEKAWINRTLLSAKPLVYVGLISYPLYLVHWPIFYLLRQNNKFNLENKVLAILVSIAGSWLIFRILERPIRHNRKEKLTASVLLMVMGVFFLASFALRDFDLSVLRYPVKYRSDLQQLNQLEALNDMPKMYGEKTCFIYDQKFDHTMFERNGCFDIKFPGHPKVFLWGDSHSASLSLGLRPMLEERRINFLQESFGWCEPTLNVKSFGKYDWCEEINKTALRKIAELKPQIVILHSWWTTARDTFYQGQNFGNHLVELVARIKKLGAGQVIIIGPVPTFSEGLPALIRRYVLSGQGIPDRMDAEINRGVLEYDKVMSKLPLPAYSVYFSAVDSLCAKTACKVRVCDASIEKCAIAWDYGHLTIAGATYLSEKLFESRELQKLLNGVGTDRHH